MRTIHCRLRLSGIRVADFERIQDDFDDLTGVRPSPDQRRRRGDQLRKGLEGVFLPVIDILLTPRLAPRSLLGQAELGGWFKVWLRPGFPRTSRIVVIVGDPDREGGEARTYGLVSFRRVASPAAERLRDIFSLAHVADLGEDEGSEGEPTPEPPPIPPAPEPGMIVVVRVPPMGETPREVRLLPEDEIGESWTSATDQRNPPQLLAEN